MMKHLEAAGSIISDPSVAVDGERLSGHLGTFQVVATVLAYNAPLATIVGFLPFVILLGNGLGAPLTFIACGLILMLFAVGFTTMSKFVPNAGAYYAYITVGLGRSIGLGSAMLAVLTYVFIQVGCYLFTSFLILQLTSHYPGLPQIVWWKWASLLWVVVAVLGYFRISLSASVMTIALGAEVLAVLLWEAAIVYVKGPSVLDPSWLTPHVIVSGSIGVALLFGMTSFAGFEATAVFREEAKNASVTIPRATYLSIGFMALLFMSATFLLIAGYGPAVALSKLNANAAQFATNSFGTFLGHIGIDAIDILMCTSGFAGCLALHNVLARYVYCLSVDGVFPRTFGEVHHRFKSPAKASGLASFVTGIGVCVCVAISMDPYDGYGILVGVAGIGLLSLQVLTSASVVAFFRKERQGQNLWKALIAPGLACLIIFAITIFAGANLALLVGNEKTGIMLLVVFAATFIAGVFYARYLRGRNPRVYEAIGRQKI